MNAELIQQRQHVNDLEEELQLLQKHLKATQAKVVEQVNVNKKNSFFFLFNIRIL